MWVARRLRFERPNSAARSAVRSISELLLLINVGQNLDYQFKSGSCIGKSIQSSVEVYVLVL